MGRVIWLFLTLVILLLSGCPAKDWVKRDDAYLTVEQYKKITEVVRINDTLYRVKKGEEINQNKITQLFVNLQQYINTPKTEKKSAFIVLRKKYRQNGSTFNSLTYALVLLERKANQKRIIKVLKNIGREGILPDEKNLANLAHILHSTLIAEVKLKKRYMRLSSEHDLVKEENKYLNKQINALKSIEDSILAREVSVE